MGLISKTVKTKWGSANKKWYKEKGYTYTKQHDEFEVKVEDLKDGSHVKVEVSCDENSCSKILKVEWRDYLKHINNGGTYYCHRHSNSIIANEKMRITKLKQGKSFEQWCIENNRQDVLERWDYELNIYLPSEVGYSTNIKCWFKCSCNKNHKSELKNINSFTQGQQGSIDCYQCNSIGQYILDNYSEEFLNKVWNWELNNKLPFEYSQKSKRKVWWNCLNDIHETYNRSIDSSNLCGFRCSKCVLYTHQSKLQEKVSEYLDSLNYNVIHEFECTLTIRNPKTNKILPYDNEIVIGDRHLIIEVMGQQHYEISGWDISSAKQNNTTPEYELHFKQLKDRYKRIKCIQNNYEYLAIPYWTEDDESYKRLIDNKLKEIMEEGDI